MTLDSITCPRCGRTSRHPDDIRAGYCGACHDWTTPTLSILEWDPMADDECEPSLLCRAGEALTNVLFCPSCLGLRLGPRHLSKLLSVGRH